MGLIKTLFDTSPFEPLMHHFEKVRECVSLVRPMFDTIRQEQYEQLEKLTDKVFKTEHQADIIKDEIRQEIPRSFFLPVYRGDLLSYLKLQDDMADSVENLAFLLTIKQLKMPEKLRYAVFAYVDVVLDVCEKAYAMNAHIRNLVAKGFHAEHANGVFEMIRSVETAEWEADKAQYRLSKSLFAMEDELKATDVMLWWRVFLELGQLANAAEKTADRLRRMLSQ